MEPKLIPLTQNQYAMVDADKFDYLNQWKWRAQTSTYGYYAVRQIRHGKNREFVSMHSLILTIEDGFETDHINHNGLDNRLSNLRQATIYDNRANSVKHLENRKFTSKYKGVSLTYQRIKDGKKIWIAKISRKGVDYSLGQFTSEIEAAMAYDKKALELSQNIHRNFP